MPAAYQDQFLEQGTTFTSQITLDDDNGLPFNLSGFTAASQGRKSYYSANADITFSADITDANNGVIILSADAPTTANLTPGKLVYDVTVTQTSTGLVTRIIEGQIFVSPSVTR